MRLFSTISTILLYQLLRSVRSAADRNKCKLHISNDGPVTLDVPVTVSAELKCAAEHSAYLYEIENDLQEVVQLKSNESVHAEFIFSDHPGTRVVRVDAYIPNQPLSKIFSGKTVVQVEDYISGFLNFSDVIENEDGHKYLATGHKTNITVHLQYPQRVLEDAEFSYSWTVGEQHFSTDHPYKEHIFTDDGPFRVRVAVVGRIPAYPHKDFYRYKWGYFNEEVTVKDPFSFINISGNTYLEHGQLLDLDISCNGSGPVEYCWKILPPMEHTPQENMVNLSCTEPVTTTDCSFPILYYFRDSGDFLLAIYINNLVTSMQRNVNVHIYDVSLRPQLSTVILPLVCSILVVLIIATAVCLHMRRRLDYHIETADFDFMRTEENSTVVVQTSWQLMRDSLLQLIHLRCLCYSTDPRQAGANYGTILVNVERTT